MKQDDKRTAVILSLIGIIPVVWLALKIAPSVGGGLAAILPELMSVFENPFHIELCEDSVKAVLVLLLCYGMGIGIYFSTRRNYRRREEHGSAKWGEARTVNKKYAQHPKSANKLMTQNVSIGLNAKKHRRNLNTLVCGGSGAGKTRFYCKPNLMQANTSFVILDPKGEIVRDVGKLLEAKGYELFRELLRTKEYVEFYLGRNGDFDILAASVIKRLHKNYRDDNSAMILVLPYPVKDYEYYEEYYNEIIIPDELHGVHPKAAITERNRWMVTNTDVLIAYIRNESGGTAACVHMAEQLGRRIIKI